MQKRLKRLAEVPNAGIFEETGVDEEYCEDLIVDVFNDLMDSAAVDAPVPTAPDSFWKQCENELRDRLESEIRKMAIQVMKEHTDEYIETIASQLNLSMQKALTEELSAEFPHLKLKQINALIRYMRENNMIRRVFDEHFHPTPESLGEILADFVLHP